MYNPDNLHECQEHIGKHERPERRKLADRAMTVIGAAASFSSAPQIIKIFQTQDALSISLTTYLIALGSVFAWFVYGAYIKNRPLLYTTGIAIIINSIVVWQIFKY